MSLLKSHSADLNELAQEQIRSARMFPEVFDIFRAEPDEIVRRQLLLKKGYPIYLNKSSEQAINIKVTK